MHKSSLLGIYFNCFSIFIYVYLNYTSNAFFQFRVDKYKILTIARNFRRSEGCAAAGAAGAGASGSAGVVVRRQRLNKAPSSLLRQRSSSLPGTAT